MQPGHAVISGGSSGIGLVLALRPAAAGSDLDGADRCPSSGESGARTAAVMERILAEFRAAASP
jgi:NAD(P)-dependent dehydrogenase (short-subunit alcohol dehydrogenase family)